ncbi:MAG: hypothetical protein HXX09_09020 [Bacteroidetes bacterium]|nr:hypothetical protein [Bacteroidota bacterium]
MKTKSLVVILCFYCLLCENSFSQNILSMFNPDTTKGKKDKEYKVHISGVLQMHYMAEFNTNGDSLRDTDGFRILRARLIAKGKINKFISYKMMIDPRAPEQGGILRDAYIEFQLCKSQSLRVGQQKTQFGYDNNESITKEYFVNRAEVSDNLSRGFNLRDIGFGLLGHIKIKKNLRFENAITFTNGSKMNVAGPFDFSNTKNAFGRIGIRYKKGENMFRFGISAGTGGMMDYGDDPISPADDFFIKFKRLGTDLEVDNKWVFLATEYVIGTDKIHDTIDDRVGYYITLAGKTKWKVGPLLRYDVLDDDFIRPVIGAYYGLPNDKFRILLNYEMRGSIKDVPNGHDDRLYVQMQLCF